MPEYYDWEKTLSYNADITMVCGARGIGKTYGLRLQVIRDYLKTGDKFVEVVRYKNQMSLVSEGYFDRISSNGEFEGVEFRTEGRFAYLSRGLKPNGKPKWELCGYFVPLSDEQIFKKKTFNRVRRIIFDEFILNRKDIYHRYLEDEWGKLANLVSTVTRERADVDGIKPKLYLLGNALDLVNPYFERIGVNDIPNRGYSWYQGKRVLMHYADDSKYSEEMAKGTLAGWMLNIAGDRENVFNEFLITSGEYIREKTKNAKFIYGIVYKGDTLGLWGDGSRFEYFINGKVPKNTAAPIYAISANDAKINYKMARRGEKALTSLADIYAEGRVFFDTEATRRKALEVFAIYGIRV